MKQNATRPRGYPGRVISTLRVAAGAAASALLVLSLAACAGGGSAPTASSAAPGASASASAGAPAAATEGACAADAKGVTVVVDSSALDQKPAQTWCASTDTAITAAEAFGDASVKIEGTEQYGDQVACRVNGVPAADTAIKAEDGSDYFETCKGMPAGFAYWSLWVKPAGGNWDYAQEGASTQQLQPGDSVQFLFSLNGQPTAPAAPAA